VKCKNMYTFSIHETNSVVVENEGLTALIPNFCVGYGPQLVPSTTYLPLLGLPSGQFPRCDPTEICMHFLSFHPSQHIYLCNLCLCIIYMLLLDEKFLKNINYIPYFNPWWNSNQCIIFTENVIKVKCVMATWYREL
jgi:hypothetical protein